ncbi:ABC exporter membrane fusion protein [Cyanothece sp. BG0011]
MTNTELKFDFPYSRVQNQAIAVTAPTLNSVVALGRIEPKGELVNISAPTSFEGSRLRLAQLLVNQGEKIKKGQKIAILDNYQRLHSALLQAQQNVQVAQARLQQVKAGASQGEIEAQKAVIDRIQVESIEADGVFQATIARLQAQLRNAQADYERYEHLYNEGALSASDLDSRKLAVETAQAQLDQALANRVGMNDKLEEQRQEAMATLQRIQEVRPVDIQVAQAEVDMALAAVRKAESNLNAAIVYSPQDGQVMDIYTRPGEVIDEQGIIEVGQTEQMLAIAEVYETDVSRVQLGDEAIITSPSFSGELKGTVSQIDLKINKQDILDTDPLADEDARIVEVHIALTPQDSQKVSGLTNLRIKVTIPTS